jgi:hypothetical protein
LKRAKNKLNDCNAMYGENFRSTIVSPFKFKMFLLRNLPMGILAGLKIISLDGQVCKVSVPFNYLTKNPFRSTYFACLSMAAELSQGAIAMSYCFRRNPSVSLLPVKMEADFLKKATGKVVFECMDGEKFMKAVEESIETGESRQVFSKSIGRDEKGEQIATFHFTWSFKVKKK